MVQFWIYLLYALETEVKWRKHTGRFAGDMTEKGSHFFLSHELSSSGTKPKRLIEGSSSNEGLVVPEINSVSYGSVPFGKELLKLINLKVIWYGLVTAEFGPPAAFPSLRAHLLALHFLHFNRFVLSICNQGQERYSEQKQNHDRTTTECHHSLQLWSKYQLQSCKYQQKQT